MEKIMFFIFVCMLLLLIAVDSRAAMLCKQGFSCPIIENMSSDGHSVGANVFGDWEAKGPWGAGGTMITVNGKSMCSTEGSTVYGEIGHPENGMQADRYCWCQMSNNGLPSAWVFFGDYGVDFRCGFYCTDDCLNEFTTAPAFRKAICVPPTDNTCDSTTIIADGGCPAGYAQCTGTRNGGDIAGQYTITCSE
ncbi:MAG: hypothetical protein LBT45_03500 [Rickettsiales bacterium]|jgi:hypothetical protein|nr:hypothetical protein [Rickettsiales bacterium]